MRPTAGHIESETSALRARDEEREQRARDERHEQREPETEDDREPREPLEQEDADRSEDPFRVALRHAPDTVQRRIELHERAARTEQERSDSDHGGEPASAPILLHRGERAIEHVAYGRARHGDHLEEPLSRGGAVTEDEPHDRDREEEQGEDRECRVVRERRAEAVPLVVREPLGSVREELDQEAKAVAKTRSARVDPLRQGDLRRTRPARAHLQGISACLHFSSLIAFSIGRVSMCNPRSASTC